MMSSGRDILVLLKNERMTEKEIALKIQSLDPLFKQAESDDSFCAAHELVDRNHITSKKNRMLKEGRYFRLRAFRFFINKN